MNQDKIDEILNELQWSARNDHYGEDTDQLIDNLKKTRDEAKQAIQALITEARVDELKLFENRLNHAQKFEHLRKYKNERLKELENGK